MRSKLIGAAAIAMLLGGAALAQKADVQDLRGQSQVPPSVALAQEAPTYVVPPAEEQAKPQDQDRMRMRGLMVTAGAGAEGYTGPLRHDVRTGIGWGVTGSIKPTKVFGLELGYSGAANQFSNEAFTSGIDTSTGVDMIRNGAHVAATFGLGAAPVQPYVLAGIGIDRYTVRPGNTFFRDTTSGNIPLGLGIRTYIGRFTADLRGAYNVVLSNHLTTSVGSSPGLGGNILNAGRWDGTLNLGGTF